MKMPDFDSDFISEWESNYYKCPEDYKDEATYRRLIELVKKDVASKGTIPKETLKKIMKWKLGHYYSDNGNRYWGKYETIYLPRFRVIISGSIADHHKLFILIWDESKLKDKLPVASGILDTIYGKAYGFGVPVASTVLHFIFPDKFPIIDIRTVEVVYLTCQIKSPNRYDYRIYEQFRSAMLEIASNTGFPLHKIDRALFAYHRDFVQHEMNRIFKRWISASELGPELNLTLDAPPRLRRFVLDKIKRDP